MDAAAGVSTPLSELTQAMARVCMPPHVALHADHAVVVKRYVGVEGMAHARVSTGAGTLLAGRAHTESATASPDDTSTHTAVRVLTPRTHTPQSARVTQV